MCAIVLGLVASPNESTYIRTMFFELVTSVSLLTMLEDTVV